MMDAYEKSATIVRDAQDMADAMQKQECEKLSGCCGAPQHGEVEGMCARCRDWAGFECSVHEVEWNDDGLTCPTDRVAAPGSEVEEER